MYRMLRMNEIQNNITNNKKKEAHNIFHNYFSRTENKESAMICGGDKMLQESFSLILLDYLRQVIEYKESEQENPQQHIRTETNTT